MDQLETLLYQALAAELGIVLRVNDFERANQALYAARRKCGDPSLDVLQFRRSPVAPETELWVVRGAEPGAKPKPAPFDPTALTRLDLDESHLEDSAE